MTVNADSVIPVWINSWRSDFYDSITDKENWCYTNQSETNWKPLFQQLADAMTAYKGFNRETELTNFYFGTYGYFVMGTIYGTDTSLQSTLDSRLIYNMSGFVSTTINRSVDYYNDYAIIPPAVTGSSAKMTADLATVNGANASETSLIGNRSSATLPTVKRMQVDLLFQDIPTIATSNKADMVQLYFETLHWKETYQLNVGTLTLPPNA